MKAVIYNGPRDVKVTQVDDAKIERPTDVVVRLTTTNICGSDLHMYEGRTDLEPGKTGFCLTTNPGPAGAAYGFAGMGPYNGGQAEYLRVPFADFDCLQLPDGAEGDAGRLP